MRDYANIVTAIWRDPAFRALCAGPQRTYLMLVTQEDISGAGTLDLTVRRWASNAANTTRESIEGDLAVLEAAGFVHIDEDTEELLVRTFVKHDKGYNNPKRRPVILAAAKMIRSPKLRRVLWAELAKLGLEDSLPALAETSTDSLSVRPSESPPDTASSQNRVVVTAVGTDTSTLNPQVPPSAGGASPPPGNKVALFAASDAPAVAPSNSQQLMAYWIERCHERPPQRVVGHMSREISSLLKEGISAEYVRAAIDEYLTKDLSPGVLPSLVNAAMNRRPPASRASPQQGQMATTDRKILAGKQIAAQLRALEAS